MPSPLSRQYNRASLSIKISAPFILMFCVFWVAGSSVLGQYFSRKLDQQKNAQAREAAALVERNLEKELYSLRQTARLLVTKQSIIDAVTQENVPQLRQEFLPLTSILDTDFIELYDREAGTLFSTRQHEFNDAVIEYQGMTELLLAGADLSAILKVENPENAILAGTAPIKNDQGIIGGLFLGIAMDDDFLHRLVNSVDGEIVITINETLVGTTFSANADIESASESLEAHTHDETSSIYSIQVDNRPYLLESIHFDGMGHLPVDVMLLVPKQSLIEAKQTLWIFIGIVTVMGILLITVIGYILANAVSKPIRVLSSISRTVVEENDFDVQSPIDSADEIGTLSNDLNQLIRWVKTYTQALEASAHTLESRVKERTQALSVALSDLKEVQSQLIQTEKMSSLGQMVAGIAHEINNPVSFIQGNLKPLFAYVQDLTELLFEYQAEYPHPSDAIVEKQEELEIEFVLEDLEKLCQSIKMGTQRVRDIIVSLRNYSRLDEAEVKRVYLEDGLDSTLLILGHRLKQGIEIIKHYGSPPPVSCSPAQLNQVFTNIMANAIDAMVDADSNPKQLVLTTRVCDDGQVQISIKDTGPGMTPEIKSKIFDPFFTTKEVGKGTGLGLGICFKIVEQHRGSIEVISEVGKGTEFVITLPTNSLLDLSDVKNAESTATPAID